MYRLTAAIFHQLFKLIFGYMQLIVSDDEETQVSAV